MEHNFRYPTIIKKNQKYNLIIGVGHVHTGKTISIKDTNFPLSLKKILNMNYKTITEHKFIVHNFTVFINKDGGFSGIGGLIRNQFPFE